MQIYFTYSDLQHEKSLNWNISLGLLSNCPNIQPFYKRTDTHFLDLLLGHIQQRGPHCWWHTVQLKNHCFRAFSYPKPFFFFEKKAYPLGDRILLGLGSPSKPGGGGKESPPSLRMISSLWRLQRIGSRLLNEKLCLFPTLFIQTRLKRL